MGLSEARYRDLRWSFVIVFLPTPAPARKGLMISLYDLYPACMIYSRDSENFPDKTAFVRVVAQKTGNQCMKIHPGGCQLRSFMQSYKCMP